MKMIDLSHPLENNISTYPGSPAPQIEQIHEVSTDGWSELAFRMQTHHGTHIDAPSHILAGGRSLDQLGLAKFCGSAIRLDCRNQKNIPKDLLEQYSSRIAKADFVLFYTGWQHRWKQLDYLSNFPVLTEEACQYLVQFKLKAVGFDTISPDPVGDTTLVNHRILLEKEILILENLTRLDQLPEEESFRFSCFPLPFQCADGSPVRAVAEW